MPPFSQAARGAAKHWRANWRGDQPRMEGIPCPFASAPGSRGEKESWIVDYRDQQGARRIHTFARKEDADEYHATIKVNVRQGVHTAPSKT
jgi:hypothetical protein